MIGEPAIPLDSVPSEGRILKEVVAVQDTATLAYTLNLKLANPVAGFRTPYALQASLAPRLERLNRSAWRRIEQPDNPLFGRHPLWYARNGMGWVVRERETAKRRAGRPVGSSGR